MKMETQETPYKLIGALLLGTVIGVGIGILFAPDKGTETRKKLLAKSDGLSDVFKEKFNGFLNEMQTAAGAVEDEANQVLENGARKAAKA